MREWWAAAEAEKQPFYDGYERQMVEWTQAQARKGKKPKPQVAYVRFCQRKRLESSVKIDTTQCGQMWKNATDEEKRPFVEGLVSENCCLQKPPSRSLPTTVS